MRNRSRTVAAVGFAVLAAVAGVADDVQATVPSAIAARWQPLRPASGDPTYGRAELKKTWRAHGKKRFRRACSVSEKLRVRLMKEGAALFYKPVRKGANVDAIKAFMKRHVQGTMPLLQIAHEVLVPSAAFRNLAVDACMRAGKAAIAQRFLDQAAASSKDSKLRTAVAVVRLGAGQSAAEVAWLVGRTGGGARAALVRGLGAPRTILAQRVAEARKQMGLSEREDVEAVIAWLSRPSKAKR
jgi:hypothetical protein